MVMEVALISCLKEKLIFWVQVEFRRLEYCSGLMSRRALECQK
jgi:hypothetical protein